ncbi:Vmc-like lipoprotein signal peptide domain-containing protein [Spiroplasma turonicum]|uniref:Lipoprotein n=1 Tax=Spiroplasma turonicum TaxID=216946 RepID=A0A0K1P5Z3_9MOLU|nr:hypothetical protein [Spiroplasma turonicum]AKU79733.1 hypothetical protein STURON_00487 [Spiroplasma turonicum]ALX70751.1 hypothetical protein STURO_v1c04850 [Spiroplasma turonicum]
MNRFKKLLFSLLSLSIIATSTSTIVSCQVATDNTYKKLSDIQNLWDYKQYKTISVDSLNLNKESNNDREVLSNLSNEIIKLIGFRFNNFDVNETELKGKNTFFGNELDFNIYKSNDTLTKAIFSTSTGKIKDLKTILDHNFWDDSNKKDNKQEISLFFKYKLENESDDDLNTKFLDFKITNKPLFEYEFEKNGKINSIKYKKFGNLLTPDSSGEVENIKVDSYYNNSLSIIKDAKFEDNDNFKKINSNAIQNSVKGLFYSIYQKFGLSANDFELNLTNKEILNDKLEYTTMLQLFTPEEYLTYMSLHNKDIFKNLKNIAVSIFDSSDSSDSSKAIKEIFGLDNARFI